MRVAPVRLEERPQASGGWFDVYRPLLEQFPSPVWHSGTDASCDYFNRAWLSFRGRTLQQERGDGWLDGVHPDDRDECRRRYQAAFEGRRPFQMEYRLRRHDGDYRWVLDIGKPLFGSSGAFSGFIGTCYDVTDRRNVAALREEYLNTISHDLRQPLAAIVGQAHLIARKVERAAPEAGVKENVESLLRCAKRMTRMLEQLTEAARLESRQLEVHKKRVDLRPFLVELVARLSQVEGGSRLRLKLGPRLQSVRADPDLLERAVVNLVTNALRYSSHEVVIGARNEPELRRCVLTVADRGAGIPPEVATHLFERYRRGRKARHERADGLGLGLYITGRLVEEQGGCIWFDTAKGKGTIFSIALPASRSRACSK